MGTEIRIALAGVGGYGRTYLRALLDEGAARGARLVAGIDPNPPADAAGKLAAAGAPVLASPADFFDGGGAADLVIVAAPIHLHAPLSCAALERGAHVLCEKPLAGSVADGLRIVRAAEAAGRFAAVGYQWSSSDAIRALKADIIAGVFGRPRRMRTICVWPRQRSYYRRSSWAGRLVMDDGSAVYDSPANNAAAHYLHNMFYLAGPEPGRSAMPAEVTAELYRGNPIESYDTAAIRARTEGGVEVLFYATHAGRPQAGPVFDLEFERASVHYDADQDPVLRARMADGSVRGYGDPNATRGNRLWQAVDSVRTGAPPACDARAALAQSACVAAAVESSGIRPLPGGEVLTDHDEYGDGMTWMPGLSKVLWESYDAWRLPSETGKFPWTAAGRKVQVMPPAS